MLQFDLSVNHGSFHAKFNASVAAGEVLAVFGRSGSGKTTLLRTLAGLSDAKVSGRVEFGGWHAKLKPEHRGIAYVAQQPVLLPHLSVLQNLLYTQTRNQVDRRIVERMVDAFELRNLLDRRVNQISGGQCQRAALARAFCGAPKLLLLDEPFAALDSDSRRRLSGVVRGLINEFKLPTVFVSHSLDEVVSLADRLILIERGEQVGLGNLMDMLTRLDLDLAHRADARAIVDATVTAHDEQFHLTYLESNAGNFSVMQLDMEVGEAVRLELLAKDVSVALGDADKNSILNRCQAKVIDAAQSGIGQTLLLAKSGDTPLLARITDKSLQQLGLSPGKEVFLQVKSVAVNRA